VKYDYAPILLLIIIIQLKNNEIVIDLNNLIDRKLFYNYLKIII